jgi:putative transposase
MGIGHANKQQSLFKTSWKHRLSHGGVLRQKKLGRGARPLSSKDPLHLVFKIDKARLRSRSLRTSQCFALTNTVIAKYAQKFQIRIDQLSIQPDHIHVLLRAPKRHHFQSFFRVVAGQIAQRLLKEGLLSAVLSKESTTSSQAMIGTPKRTVTGTSNKKETEVKPGTKLWKHRPFTRVIRGWRAFRIVRDYVRLNEQEARGVIPYRKERLRGLSSQDWQLLWT